MANEEPPYLAVGTDVSAKYKGAFCEAKVKKVTRSVKCKVTFKNNLGSITVPDDQIKGNLRVNAQVEVRHPEKNQFFEAVINKLHDQSQYTVVFDDGDETTLRRTSLCLKSGRHFAESETLDQLPLTHPEHFGTPVMGSKGRKRRSLNRSVQDDGSSDEEVSPPPKKKELKTREPDPDIGKVVCVELSEKKKSKDNWFPALIVSPSAQDSVKVTQKEDYLVRSFKDGKYYCICKKETKEFTREIGAKVDNNTLKIAVEKAQVYSDKGELPPHWDRDILFRREFTSDEGDSNEESDSETSDDEPSEEKDRFVAQLYKFMDDRGTPINKAPTVSNRDLNLYKLFKVVQKLGGYNRVTNHMQWKTVYTKMGLPSYNSSSSHQIKQAYKKYLHSFEDFYRKLGCSMGTSTRAGRMRHRSGRKMMMLTRDREREFRVAGRKKQENKSKKKDDKTKEEDTEEKKEEDERDESKDEDEEKVDEVKEESAETKEEEKLKMKEEKKTKAKKEKLLKKGDKEIDKGIKPKGRRKMNREEGSDKNQDTTDEGDFCSDVEINVGDKVRVKYGRGRHQKIYEAKVLELEEENGEKHFYVHYTGWNMRYDEWVNRQRIVENLSLKVRKGRSAGSPKTTLVKIPAKRGRPPMSAGKGPAASRKMGLTTPKSRATRSDKNSLNDSPFVNGLEPQRRMRNKSGPKVSSKGSTDDSSSDESDLGLSPDGKKRQEKPEKIKLEDNKEPSDDDEESVQDRKHEDDDFQKDLAKKERDDDADEMSVDDDECSSKQEMKLKVKDKVVKNKDETEVSASDPEVSSEEFEEKSSEKKRDVKVDESEDDVSEEVAGDVCKVKRRGRRKTKKKKDEPIIEEYNDADDEEAKPTTDEEEKDTEIKNEIAEVREETATKSPECDEVKPEVLVPESPALEMEMNYSDEEESAVEEKDLFIKNMPKLCHSPSSVVVDNRTGDAEIASREEDELSKDEKKDGSEEVKQVPDVAESPKLDVMSNDDKDLDADLEKLAKQTKKMGKLKDSSKDTDDESLDSDLDIKSDKDVRAKRSKTPEIDVAFTLPIKLDAATEILQETPESVTSKEAQAESVNKVEAESSENLATTASTIVLSTITTTDSPVKDFSESVRLEPADKLVQEIIVAKPEDTGIEVIASRSYKEPKKPKTNKKEDQSSSECSSEKMEEPKKKSKDEEKKNKVKRSKDKKKMKKEESGGKDLEKSKKKESKKRKEEKLKKFDSDMDSRESTDNRKKEKKSRKNKQDDKRRDGESPKKKSKKKFSKDDKVSDEDNGKKSSKKSGKRKKKKCASSDDPESVKSKKTDKQSKSGLAKMTSYHQEEEEDVPDVKEDSENEDLVTSLLMCQEDIPLSPVGEDVSSKVDSHLASFPQTSRFDMRPLLPLTFSSNNSTGSGSSSCTSGSVKDTQREARYTYQKPEPMTVLDNTPPTTPESGGESVLSGSLLHEQDSNSPGLDDTSTKSGPDSYIDLESYGDVSQLVCHENVDFGQSEAAMVLGSMGVVQGYQKEHMLIDMATTSSSKRPCNDNEEMTPSKKRKKGRQRCLSGSDVNVKGMNISRYRASNKLSKATASDSDETTHSDQATIFQSMPHASSGSSSGSSYTGSDREVTLMPSAVPRSPRPSKFNFFVELDDYSDGSQRIAIIQEKLTELKKTYMALKAEVACIDRRRKKLRRKEKEGTASTVMSSTTEVECS